MKKFTKISAEIKKGISLKKPIVALESTLISHGLPYPDKDNHGKRYYIK